MNLYHRCNNKDYNWWVTTGGYFDGLEGIMTFEMNPELRAATMLEF